MKNHEFTLLKIGLCICIFCLSQFIAFPQPGSKETWDKTPPSLENDNSTMLVVLKGFTDFDKEFAKQLRKLYHGKIKFISHLDNNERLGNKKYDDIEKYRFILEYVVDKTYNYSHSIPVSSNTNMVQHTELDMYLKVLDRKEEKSYYGRKYKTLVKRTVTKYLKLLEKRRVGKITE